MTSKLKTPSRYSYADIKLTTEQFKEKLRFLFRGGENAKQLQHFITSPDAERFLGWKNVQDISLGIAKGVEYLHQQILYF